MSGPRAPHSLRHEPQSTPLKFEEPPKDAAGPDATGKVAAAISPIHYG
jgi:hypothetical protein